MPPRPGLTGLEFLSGIPGSIGGAVAMNAGAYGGDVATVLDWAEIVTRSGEPRRLARGAAGVRLSPRRTAGRRRGAPGPGCARCPGGAADRRAHGRDPDCARGIQPVRARTGGSTFRNPDGMKAWELIDAAGCRGLTRGGAKVSEKHCNFLINTGGATAADIEGLGEEVRRRVLAATGVTLDWEIRRIGIPAGKPEVVA